MVELTITYNKRKMASLEHRLRHMPKQIKPAIRGAVADTARKVKTRISSMIRERVVIKKQDLDKHIRITRKATNAQPTARITLEKSRRLGLRAFTARETKRGVTYRIAKGTKRARIPEAFIVEGMGGQVFKRDESELRKLHGVSAWGVFVKNKMRKRISREASKLLIKATDRRIKLALLKHAGKV